MPLDGTRLVIEPKYPNAAALMEIGPAPAAETQDQPIRLRNSFYSHARRIDISIFERDGKIDWGWLPAVHGISYAVATIGAADAWGIEQEHNAVQTLGRMLRHRQFKQYLLTGMFMERSARSGVHYVFRRLRPTVALREHHDKARILCALCMHPIGFYEGSWAGAMTPTDDVIAHLALMRGDEPMFWRRCNQHAAYRPEAGL